MPAGLHRAAVGIGERNLLSGRGQNPRYAESGPHRGGPFPCNQLRQL